MTETIQQLKEDIAILQVKLQKLENQKSPVEIAFKDNYGIYPDELKSNDDLHCWVSFKRGYIAAKQEKVSGYQPTSQTPEQVEQGLRDAMKTAKAEGVFDEPEPETLTLKQLIKKWEIDFSAKWVKKMTRTSELYEEELERFIQMFTEWMPGDSKDPGDGKWDKAWNCGYNAYRGTLLSRLK